MPFDFWWLYAWVDQWFVMKNSINSIPLPDPESGDPGAP